MVLNVPFTRKAQKPEQNFKLQQCHNKLADDFRALLLIQKLLIDILLQNYHKPQSPLEINHLSNQIATLKCQRDSYHGQNLALQGRIQELLLEKNNLQANEIDLQSKKNDLDFQNIVLQDLITTLDNENDSLNLENNAMCTALSIILAVLIFFLVTLHSSTETAVCF